MLSFDLHDQQGKARISVEPGALIVAGWTGRDEAALRHHIEELAAIGVPRPTSVPVFYRNSLLNLTQVAGARGLGRQTPPGEVEPVIIAASWRSALLLAVGSDHTDRKAETQGIAPSKQLCAKSLGRDLWLLEDIAGHWDQLRLRSVCNHRRPACALSGFPYAGGDAPARRPDGALHGLAARTRHRDVLRNSPRAIGGIPACRPLRDGDGRSGAVPGRTLKHAYDINVLPVIS